MSPEQNKRITYDLALEYAKQHQHFLDVDVVSHIPEMVDHFASVCEKFSKAISESQKMQNLF